MAFLLHGEADTRYLRHRKGKISATPMIPRELPASPRPLRVAFVGAGRMARQHLQALRCVAQPHRVLSVFDSSERAARELAAIVGVVAYPSLTDLLRDAEPDVVHVCTSAGMHFEAAHHALQAGAHVYVEKPFVETQHEADVLLRLAAARRRLVCAGHQLLWDHAFLEWLAQAADLAPLHLIDSHFTFHPPRVRLDRAGSTALAEQLLDILPHPLYTLVAALERFGGPDPVVASLQASPTEVSASVCAGPVTGRLFVSLRTRPVASTLTASGDGGALTADFVRSIVFGAANPGTSAIEKILNPALEGWQLQSRSAVSLFKRLLVGGGYPGLAEILGAFYRAVASGGASPLAPAHLRSVTSLYEHIAEAVRRPTRTLRSGRPAAAPGAPIAVLTGARGYLGKEIARHLVRRGFRVRGVGRVADVDDPDVHEWVTADLGEAVPAQALVDAAVVIHAAAETAGGYEAHQRNSVDATSNVLRAMGAANVRRLVYISSLSVLQPPRTPWERQNERTPLATNARTLGAYTWGKCVAEQLVAAEAPRLGITTRVIRPAALIDFHHPGLPGLVGRRLFGRWHLGLGRPGLPIATCEVGVAGEAIAWCVACFEDAPPIVNLIDGTRTTRRELLRAFREHGWRGRVVWIPISVLAGLLSGARSALALARWERPSRLAAWEILRPRRFDEAVASRVLTLARHSEPARRSSGGGVLSGPPTSAAWGK